MDDKFVIVFQGQQEAGVVKSYDSSQHLGVFTYEGAMAHAKRLAMTNNSTIYVVANVGNVITMSKDQYTALKEANPDWKTVGDLYSSAGCTTDEKASRLF